MFGLSQVLPVVDIEREKAHPWTIIVCLIPYAFVDELPLIAGNPIQVLFRAIQFYLFDKRCVLWFQWFEDDLPVDVSRLRKWSL